ncbi:hypothetical protein V1505DRAFT_377580 [Lipomyces doorenjongii]
MCHQSTCATCSGKTWFGCGHHIPSVLDHIPKEEWCSCPKSEGSQYPPMGPSPVSTLFRQVMAKLKTKN